MYRCNDCGRDFESPEVVSEAHPYGNGSAVEQYLVCPHCYGDYERVYECSECGRYFEADDMSQDIDGVCCDCEDIKITALTKHLCLN